MGSLLADRVLPLIRTRGELWGRAAATAHGRQMHEAVAILYGAAEREDPAVVFTVTQRAIGSAITIILRADDSNGVIGDAIDGLLALHPRLAAKASVPPARLVEWMIRFQFDGRQDFFNLDPVAYAPALGAAGTDLYRSRLAEIYNQLGPERADDQYAPRLRVEDPAAWDHVIEERRTRFVLDYNAQRLAVLDRDVDAIIATHAPDRTVASRLHDTAKALAEIGETDPAIDWAREATNIDHGHQARQAARYWCDLITEHHPDQLCDTCLVVFNRWPTAETANDLRQAARDAWPRHKDHVTQTLAAQPREAVRFTLDYLREPARAWELAHQLGLADNHTWETLADAYAQIDPAAVLPVLGRLVDLDLQVADARNYRSAAHRLQQMRALSAATPDDAGVDQLIADLRHRNRHRPRLQREFDAANLP
ncbi:MAG TPA: hypothetical protein VHA73_05680 [Acidimicrobiales bacterium]|jgi:hypothetical protein|nr:hypothetical protein [Acidimicrobiales bacterium]